MDSLSLWLAHRYAFFAALYYITFKPFLRLPLVNIIRRTLLILEIMRQNIQLFFSTDFNIVSKCNLFNFHYSIFKHYNLYLLLGLRHLTIVDGDNRVVGILTRNKTSLISVPLTIS